MADSPRDELARRIEEYPTAARSFFKNAFAAASKLPEDVQRIVFQHIRENIARGVRHVEGSTLQPITKLVARESEQIASVYTLVIGLLTEPAVTAEEFANLAKGILFEPEHEGTALSIGRSIVANREELTRIVERTQLAGEVLPSLSTLSIVVDLRLAIENGSVKTTVPVAIVRIDTDSDQRLYIQLTLGEVEDMINQLSETLQSMKTAEKTFPSKK
jgi:hypothetical protein